MSQKPELPNLGGNNPTGSNKTDFDPNQPVVWVDGQQNQQIIWEESEDVYKPIPKNIKEFKSERSIQALDFKQVYIKSEALQNLKTHLRSNLKVEQGGILFGNAYQDPVDGIYVEITAAVPAPATIGTGAHLEFTSDSWLGIMDHAKHQHPQDNIVGWYHSHPNLGVFMSGTDMNTQEAFFSHPWCLSIVCDPVRNKTGYFLGKNATKVEPVEFAYPHTLTYQTAPQQPDPAPGSVRQIEPQPISPIPDDNQQEKISANTTTGVQKLLKSSTSPLVAFFAVVIVGVACLFPIGISLMGIWFPTSYDNATNILSETSIPSVNPAYSQIHAHLIRMQAQDFAKFNRLNLLKYPVIDAGETIGNGPEVVLLVIILPDTIEPSHPIELEIEKFVPEKGQAIYDDIDDLVNLIKNPNELLQNNESTVRTDVSTPPLRISPSSLQGGVFLPLFTSHPASPTNLSNSQTREIRDVIYIPRHIMYTDGKNNLQKLQIFKLINND